MSVATARSRVCATCMDAPGVTDGLAEGAGRSTLAELAEMNDWAARLVCVGATRSR